MPQAVTRTGRRTQTHRHRQGAWTPAILANKLLWLDGLTLPGDGSPVSAWNCSFGTGRSAAQANPTFRPTAASGGGATFNAAHRLNVAHESALNPTCPNLAVVLTTAGAANFSQPLSKTNGATWSQGYALYWSTTSLGRLNWFLNDYNANVVVKSIAATAGPNVFVCNWGNPGGGSVVSIRKDADSAATVSYGGPYTGTTDPLSIGSSNDGAGAGAYPWKGIIREVILCGGSAPWDSTTQASVFAYLKAKWGTP